VPAAAPNRLPEQYLIAKKPGFAPGFFRLRRTASKPWRKYAREQPLRVKPFAPLVAARLLS
jgi:hypothetical protein